MANVSDTIGMNAIIALAMVAMIASCSKYEPDTRSENSDVLNDFHRSKTIWTEAKRSITMYEIEHSGCGMVDCSQVIVLIDARTDTPISCTEKYNDFHSTDFVIRDCMDRPYYLKTVDDYFKEFESIMLSGPITKYSFDPKYGVPILVVGTKMDQMADSGAPAFYFKFSVR